MLDKKVIVGALLAGALGALPVIVDHLSEQGWTPVVALGGALIVALRDIYSKLQQPPTA